MTLAGGFAPFKDIARAALATTVARLEIDVDVDVDVDDVMDGFRELEPFPDAADAVAHAPNGAVLTNGSAKDTQELLRRGGINKHVIGVEEVRAYKPHPAPYRLTAEQLGDRILLVSAHAWDVLGAQAAGFESVWVDRGARLAVSGAVAGSDRLEAHRCRLGRVRAPHLIVSGGHPRVRRRARRRRG